MKKIDERFSIKNQRINVFIGSTTENSQNIAQAIKSHFDTDQFNVDVWDEDVFDSKKSNLDNLKKFTAIYDFAIMVFINDDIVIHRNKKLGSIPPNIIFEYGLFLGHIGSNRSFIISENSIKEFIDNSFTDIKGLDSRYSFTLNKFKSYEEDVKSPTNKIIKEIVENYRYKSEISFLPSSALAIGYYKNFISQISKTLNQLFVDEEAIIKLRYGRKKVNELEMDAFLMTFKIIVIIPDYLLDAGYEGSLERKIAQYKLHNTEIVLNNRKRTLSLYWKEQTKAEIQKNGFIFYDFPTTLSASQKTIELILRDSTMNEKDADIEEIIGEKEIFNFIKTLKYKIGRSEQTYMRKCIEIISNPDDYFKNI